MLFLAALPLPAPRNLWNCSTPAESRPDAERDFEKGNVRIGNPHSCPAAQFTVCVSAGDVPPTVLAVPS